MGMGVPEGGYRNKGAKRSYLKIQWLKTSQSEKRNGHKNSRSSIPTRISPKRATLRHIIIQLSKVKNRIKQQEKSDSSHKFD